MIIVTHDRVVAASADRTVYLQNGRLHQPRVLPVTKRQTPATATG
jgi:ABC-type lipoprotein export system ATPase subunit